MASKGQEVFEKHFVSAHNRASEKGGRIAKALDPATITMIFGFILEGLKICFNRNGESTTMARVKEGGGLSQRQVYRALLQGGYADDTTNREQRKRCREMAYELAGEGKTVSAEDLQAFLDDAKEVPVLDESSGGFWIPAVMLMLCMLCAGPASAGDGFWDAEQDVKAIKASVTTLGDRVAKMERKLDRIETLNEKLANHLLPESQICEPQPTPAAPIDKAAGTLEASKLADLYKTLEAMEGELQALRAAQPKARSNVSPASSSRGITYNGSAIDVGSFIAANGNVGEVEIVRGMEDMHLRQHGFAGDFSGLSRSTKIKLHSIAHAREGGRRVATAVALPAGSNCVNGNCSRLQSAYAAGGQWKQGLFGRWRQVN